MRTSEECCVAVHMVTRVTLRIKVDLVLFRFKFKLAVVDLSIFSKDIEVA